MLYCAVCITFYDTLFGGENVNVNKLIWCDVTKRKTEKKLTF